MRLILNTLALFLATSVLAAPVPSVSNDALTDGASTGEHTLTHHHHLHHMKHPKHTAHHEESDVAARSLLNELEERSFSDEEYTQLERRDGNGKKKPNLTIVTAVAKMFKGKNKAPPSSSSSSGHSFDHVHQVGHQLSPNHGNPTPFTGHNAAPSHQAGPSNRAAAKAYEASKNKPLPPTPHRSNSLPAGGSHHDAPPPYSLHVANPGSSHSGSAPNSPVRRPQRAMSTDSGISRASNHGSTDRLSIDTPRSDKAVAGWSPVSHKRSLRNKY